MKRKRPPTFERVATRIHHASAVQNDRSDSNDSVRDDAAGPKGVRTKRGPETSSDNLDNYYSRAAVMARAGMKLQAAQAVRETLEDLVEWKRRMEKGLEEFTQGYSTLKQSHEHREAEAEGLKAHFTNLVEATVIYNASLEKDRMRHDSHEAQANADRAVVTDLTARVEKYEENTAAQLQRRPTSTEVGALIADERKAREAAVEQSTERMSATLSTSLREGIDNFHRTSLKTTIAGELAPVMDRIDTISKTLTAHREQSDAKIPKMEEDIKRCDDRNTKTATALSDLKLQLKQTPTAKDLQERIASERKDRESAVNQLRSTLTVSDNTQISARIETLGSKLENVTIPGALEPLRHEFNALNESFKRDSADVQALMTELQRKYYADYERTIQETQKKVNAVKASSTKETGTLNRLINGLQQDLATERQKRAELEKSIGQLDVSRAEDKKDLITAIEAMKQDFTRRLREMETTHATNKTALEGTINGLRAELQAEREKTVATQEAQANEVQSTVEDLRCRMIKTKADSSQESETQKAIIGRIQGEYRTLTSRVDNISDAIVEARTHNTSESCGQDEMALESAINRLHTELHTEQTKAVIIEAAHANRVHGRLSKLEITGSPGPADQIASIAKIQTDLQSLTSRIDDLSNTIKASDSHRSTLQTSVDECVAIAKPTSADTDLLKHQHNDHVANQIAQIQEQGEIAKAHVNQIERQLRGRIVDQELALQNHLHYDHNRSDSPQFLEVHGRVYAPEDAGPQGPTSIGRDIAQLQKCYVALEVRVDDFARSLRKIPADPSWDDVDLPLQLVSFKNCLLMKFDELMKCIADDLTELTAQIRAQEAHCDKHGKDFTNLESQLNTMRRNVQARGF